MIRHFLFLTVLLGFAAGAPARAQTENAVALRVKVEAALRAQNFEGVLTAGKALLALDPKDTTANFGVGVALHSTGKVDEALPYHEAAAAGSGPWAPLGAYNAACANSLKGNADKAFEWLNKAATLGFNDLTQMREDTDLKSLHNDARWSDLVAKLGGKPAKKPAMKVYNQHTPRMLTRVTAFTPSFDGCLAEVAIEYGPVVWKDSYQAQLDSNALDGVRWRLGTDFWTNVDSNVAFTLGGQKFAAGDYYAVLERAADSKKFLLTLIPTDDIRKVKADAFESVEKAKGGVSVEMTHSALTESAAKLKIVLAADSEESTTGNLTIEFGPNRLTTPFTFSVN